MKKNVGSIDKVVRVIIALVAAYFAYTTENFEPTWVEYVLWAVAVIMLLTALMGRCLIYSACGANTCKVKE